MIHEQTWAALAASLSSCAVPCYYETIIWAALFYHGYAGNDSAIGRYSTTLL